MCVCIYILELPASPLPARFDYSCDLLTDPSEYSKHLSKALERPSGWSEEAQAVAKHYLSQALSDPALSDHARAHNLKEAKRLSMEANSTRQRVWGPHSRYLDGGPGVVGGGLDHCDDEIFDHLGCCEMGRVTVGKFQASTKLPWVAKMCHDIQGRLQALGEGRISATACCIACKGNKIDISEVERTLYDV